MGQSLPKNNPDAWADDLCEWLSDGKTLRSFCRQPNAPAYVIVYERIRKDEQLAARIARARSAGYDAIADECVDIANTPVEGVRREESENGVKEVREDMLGHRKLQIDTRLKLLAKWDPKRYGDKQEIKHSGGLAVVKASEADLGVL